MRFSENNFWPVRENISTSGLSLKYRTCDVVALRSVLAGALLGAGFTIRSHRAGVLAGHTLVARSTAVLPSHMVTSTVPLDNKYYVH